MQERLLLVGPEALNGRQVTACRDAAGRLASAIGMPVELIVTGEAHVEEAFSTLIPTVQGSLSLHDTLVPAAPASAAPMSSAPFVMREDGLPDWGEMWQSFCDLALYGGPPHRGEADALKASPPVNGKPAENGWDAIAEIRRGIWETTGLFAEPASPGWIAVSCHSTKMAAWLCACIILENVEARCEEERLFLPASPDFELKDQVKSVITVLAKTNHYWEAHVEEAKAGGAG
jgi:sirohydrochlorin cobaltochelatase